MKSLSKGFTLIELLFSTSLALIILGFFFELTAFLYRDYLHQGAFAESLQESRIATSFFQNEIQNTGMDPLGTAFKAPNIGEPIMEASETVFHFMGDRNANGNNKDGNEDVRYEWFGKNCNGGCEKKRPYTLYRKSGGENGSLQEMALGIETFRLEYFDENGNQLSSGLLEKAEREKIRSLKLTLQPVTKDKSRRGGREWISEVYFKNIG